MSDKQTVSHGKEKKSCFTDETCWGFFCIQDMTVHKHGKENEW